MEERYTLFEKSNEINSVQNGSMVTEVYPVVDKEQC